jgi:uncharacterized protein (TIGR00369 family)
VVTDDSKNSKSFKDVLGVEVDQVQEGRSRLTLDASSKHLNEAGTVHGGVLASLVDMAMGEAIRSRTGEGEVPATSQLTVTYLRPGKPGPLSVTAAISKQGEDLTVCQADVEQDGKALVHALATFAVLQR